MSTPQTIDAAAFKFANSYLRLSMLLLVLCAFFSPGAFIPGAPVTLTNEGTQISATATTTSSGYYTFEQVNPGSYTLAVNAQGFGPEVTHGIQVHVQQSVTQDYSLAPG